MNHKMKKILLLGLSLNLLHFFFWISCYILNCSLVSLKKKKIAPSFQVVAAVSDNQNLDDNSTQKLQAIKEDIEKTRETRNKVESLVKDNQRLTTFLNEKTDWQTVEDNFQKQQNSYKELENKLKEKQSNESQSWLSSLWQVGKKAVNLVIPQNIKDQITNWWSGVPSGLAQKYEAIFQKVQEEKTNLEQQANEKKTQITSLNQKLQEIDDIKTQINTLMNVDSLTEVSDNQKLINCFLNENTMWKEAEKTYQQIKTHQNNEELQQALTLLEPCQTWWQWISGSSNPSLKEVYQKVFTQVQEEKANLEQQANEKKTQITSLNQKLQEIDDIKTQINTLMNVDSLTEVSDNQKLINCFLNENTMWKEAEKTYQQIKTHQNNEELQQALTLLEPCQTWWQWISGSSNPSLKEVYQKILDDINSKIKELKELTLKIKKPNASTEDKKSWWSKITNFWPSVSGIEESPSIPEKNQLEEGSYLKKFFNNHPFITKALAMVLGEKEKDLPTIVDNLAKDIFEVSGGQVRSEVEKAKEGIQEKTEEAVKKKVAMIIIISVACATLVVTMLFWLITRKKKIKTITKTNCTKTKK
ncbi:hypothetical protein PSOLA_00700 [Candidatus Phytoplasma solani]